MRNLQEQVKKAFCYQKLFWSFTVWINGSSDFKKFPNSWPSALNFKSFSRSLEYFFLTVGQNNFGNKIPLPLGYTNVFSELIKKKQMCQKNPRRKSFIQVNKMCNMNPSLVQNQIWFSSFYSCVTISVRLYFWRWMLGPRLAFISKLQLCQLELCFCSIFISWPHNCSIFHVYWLPESKRTKGKE